MNSTPPIYNRRMSFAFPENHASRGILNDELHAHPYEPLTPPERVVSIAMLVSPEERAKEAEHLQWLCQHMGQPYSESGNRMRINFGPFRLKIERHQEFTRYKFVCKADCDLLAEPFSCSPLALLPEGWLSGLPGKILVALDISIIPYPAHASHQSLVADYTGHFDDTSLTASQVGRSGNLAMTDFRIREDGLTRLLLFSKARLSSQIGRLILRLVEMETYRMMALLSLPEARKLLRELPSADARLTELTRAIANGNGKDDEQLMEELTGLAVYVENLVATHYRRFSATHAYFDMVSQRLGELHEQSVTAIPSLGGMLSRRLEPARTTCDSVFRWLEQLANRVAHTSQLLRTRIDVRHEKQNQEILLAMNRRFQLQLRLQQAAELLSVAIFTYYATNILDYVCQELALVAGTHVESLAVKAIGAPMIAAIALLFIRRVRKKQEI